ncbi:MAG TPA: hypothetical protein ENL03_02930 [Phycisphaerae bacterium]|nr:hypothetical protein [Phycisphaerae bacterium]
MTTKTKHLPIDQIRIDGGTQPRVSIDEQVVDDYSQLYSAGTDMPPVTVFFDGATYWLADGFHRYWANRKIENDQILAEVHQGTQRDAILYSVGANADHGLRRTNADKRKAVLTMLEDEKWSTRTDRKISRQCRATHPFVGRLRASLVTVTSEKSVQKPRSYKTKHGTIATMNTANIGRHRSRGPDSPNPIRQPKPALKQTNLNLPHDPVYGARAIISAMGDDYALGLTDSIVDYLREKNMKGPIV